MGADESRGVMSPKKTRNETTNPATQSERRSSSTPSKERIKAEVLNKMMELEKQFTYTSYSVSSPTVKRNNQKGDDEIVTVSKPVVSADVEPEIERLSKITSFLPILPYSVDSKQLKIQDKNLMDVKGGLNLAAQMQWLFHQAKGEVENTHVEIKVKLGDCQQKIVNTMGRFTKFSYHVKSFAENMDQVRSIETTIMSINQNMKIIIQQLDRIYNLLPEEEKDETITPLHFISLQDSISQTQANSIE